LKYLHLAIRQGFDADTRDARFFAQGSPVWVMRRSSNFYFVIFLVERILERLL
jgi:hypothetical protein